MRPAHPLERVVILPEASDFSIIIYGENAGTITEERVVSALTSRGLPACTPYTFGTPVLKHYAKVPRVYRDRAKVEFV